MLETNGHNIYEYYGLDLKYFNHLVILVYKNK